MASHLLATRTKNDDKQQLRIERNNAYKSHTLAHCTYNRLFRRDRQHHYFFSWDNNRDWFQRNYNDGDRYDYIDHYRDRRDRYVIDDNHGYINDKHNHGYDYQYNHDHDHNGYHHHNAIYLYDGRRSRLACDVDAIRPRYGRSLFNLLSR